MAQASRNVLIVLVLVVVVLGFLSVTDSADTETTTQYTFDYDCKKVMGKIAKKMVKSFGTCSKEVKANNTKEEFDKKMGCIIKCSLDKMLLLTEGGIVTKGTIQKFMDVNVPVDAHDLGHLLIEECMEEHATKLDNEAPYCETYGDFVKCLQNNLGNFAEKNGCNPGMG